MARSFLFLFVLLAINGVSAEYDEAVAKDMLVLAAAAYNTYPESCLSSRFENVEVIGRYSLVCDMATKNTTCTGYIALIHSRKILAVAFRGTSSNLQMFEEVISGLEDKPNFMGIGRVNKYFYDAYYTLITSGMGNKIDRLAIKYPDYKLWVTGHSLGAAIATLFSADLVASGRFDTTNSVHYSFGQPRVGNQAFAFFHDLLLPEYYRITHAQDFVSGQFMPVLGYSHHGTQVWYNNNMTRGSNYVMCALDADPRCFGPLRLSMEDHRVYFNTRITQYGEQGCQTPIE